MRSVPDFKLFPLTMASDNAVTAMAVERERRPTAKIMVCKDFIRGRCSRSDCRFAHTTATTGIETTAEG